MTLRSLSGSFVLLAALAACHRASPAVSTGTAGLDARVVAQGDSIFNAISCQRCHGASGIGANNGPGFITGPWLHVDGSIESIANIIKAGVPRAQIKGEGRNFGMNPRGGPANLNDEQVLAVATYVFSISRNKR